MPAGNLRNAIVGLLVLCVFSVGRIFNPSVNPGRIENPSYDSGCPGIGLLAAQEKPGPKVAATVRKPAATAEEAFTLMVAAGKARDIDGCLACFTDDAAKLSRELFKIDADYRAANSALAAAVGNRFGIGTDDSEEFFSQEGDDKSAMAEWCSQLRFVSRSDLPGGKVKLKVKAVAAGADEKGQPIDKTSDEELIVVKQQDGWKLIPSMLPSTAQADEIRQVMPRLAQVSRDVAVAVKSGKFETREEVTAAYAESRKRVVLAVKNPIVFKQEADEARAAAAKKTADAPGKKKS